MLGKPKRKGHFGASRHNRANAGTARRDSRARAGDLRYINGYPGEAPPRAGISLGDSLAGLFALQGILMALYHRDAHGGAGQVVDASILESCFALLDNMVPEYGRFGYVREPNGTRI